MSPAPKPRSTPIGPENDRLDYERFFGVGQRRVFKLRVVTDRGVREFVNQDGDLPVHGPAAVDGSSHASESPETGEIGGSSLAGCAGAGSSWT